MFAETRPEVDRGHAPGGRRAAPRARRRRGHVRRQPQHQRVEHLRRRLRVLRLRAGQALAGRLRARRGRSSSAACEEAVEFGATEICMQSGIHPDWTIEDYEKWLRLAKEVAPEIHLHAYSPMEVDAPRGRHAARRGVRAPQGRRARLDARHRRRGARRRRARADLAEQAAREAVGRGDRGVGARRALDQRDGDVRPHRGAVGAGRAHARDPRAAGADRRVQRVRAALVHPVPHDARPHARDRGDLARGEPEAHGRVPARAREDRSARSRRAG